MGFVSSIGMGCGHISAMYARRFVSWISAGKSYVANTADQTGWNIARMESSFSAIRRSSNKHGSDPVTGQLQAIIGSNDDLGPWIPLWRMRNAGGTINWTGNLDNKSAPPDEFARMQGFTSSVSQGWLYPGDGGPGRALGMRKSSIKPITS